MPHAQETDLTEGGRPVIWGQASEDYARYRAGYPASFYARLAAWGVGNAGQQVLDLGTGTGTVARALAAAGCGVLGVDPSEGQLEAARALAASAGLVSCRFAVGTGEALPAPDGSVDVVVASQCWWYVEEEAALAEVRRVLRPGGWFVLCHLNWLITPGGVALASEQLVLEHNPAWQGADMDGRVPVRPGWDGLELGGFFVYDEDLPYTHEAWRGRMRACRGVSATLDADAVAAFDADHARVLKARFPDPMRVPHRIDAHLFRRLP
jgi:SAM-dependent methyltransferase